MERMATDPDAFGSKFRQDVSDIPAGGHKKTKIEIEGTPENVTVRKNKTGD